MSTVGFWVPWAYLWPHRAISKRGSQYCFWAICATLSALDWCFGHFGAHCLGEGGDLFPPPPRSFPVSYEPPNYFLHA